MTQTKTCPKCESSKIVPRARVIDRGDNNFEAGSPRVAVSRNPDAWFFTDTVRSDLYATVCGNCGYTEFYAEDPTDLYSAYVDSQAPRR